MEDVRRKYVPPALDQRAFNCPHCGALAKQFWFAAHADPLKNDEMPLWFDPERVNQLRLDQIDDAERRETMIRWAERMAMGRPFLECSPQYHHLRHDLRNVSVSQCFNCDEIAVWIYDRLVWPSRGKAPLPNPDLPPDVREDYDEASTLLDFSPRGAAALLRLSIQKLCTHLGESGENINADIAALVRKGLDARQQALDVVRVVGNNAVHPGQIDLRDDRAAAEKLFALVNLVAEIMISQPKHVREMFDNLPEDARRAIEKRDYQDSGISLDAAG